MWKLKVKTKHTKPRKQNKKSLSLCRVKANNKRVERGVGGGGNKQWSRIYLWSGQLDKKVEIYQKQFGWKRQGGNSPHARNMKAKSLLGVTIAIYHGNTAWAAGTGCYIWETRVVVTQANKTGLVAVGNEGGKLLLRNYLRVETRLSCRSVHSSLHQSNTL